MENNITCVLYFKYRIAATLYTLHLFFFGNIIVNISMKLIIIIIIIIIIKCVKPDV